MRSMSVVTSSRWCCRRRCCWVMRAPFTSVLSLWNGWLGAQCGCDGDGDGDGNRPVATVAFLGSTSRVAVTMGGIGAWARVRRGVRMPRVRVGVGMTNEEDEP